MNRLHVAGLMGGMMCAGVASAQLLNSSFETLDNSGLFWTNWTSFGNVLVEPFIANTGSISARIGPNFTFPFNVSGIYQAIPATAGQRVDASMFFMNPVGDPISGDNFAVLNIEWYNAANQLLNVDERRAIDATTPTGVWTQVTNSAIAPCDTASVRIVPLFVQGGQLAGGSALIDTASLAPNGTGDTLFVRNPGFETEGYLNGWISFGNAFREFQFTRTGTGALKLFGTFNGAFNVSGAYQTFCVEPGASYTATAWAGTPVADAVNDGDFAVVNIEVFDAAGQPLNVYPDPNNPGGLVNFTTTVAVAPDATPGVYTQATNTAVMPAGAAKARVVLLHVQPSPSLGGGSTWFDDVTFTQTVVAGCDSVDFNNDGVFPDDQDLSDFIFVLGGGGCGTCNDVDFNNDGVFPDDSDLATFLFVLGGGAC